FDAVIRAQMPRSKSRVLGFIPSTLLETNRERLDPVAVSTHVVAHSRRVHATAKEQADWHVSDHSRGDCRIESCVELPKGVGLVHRRILKVRGPIRCRPATLERQGRPVAGAETLDPGEDGPR